MGKRGFGIGAAVSAMLCLASCSKGGSGGGDQTLPLLSSTVSDCASVSGPCASADLSQADHVVSPMIFGDGIEWRQYGQNVLAPDLTGQTPGTLRPEVVAALKNVGFTMLRYPGGTLADLFHWQQAVGPMPSRTAQLTLDTDSGGHLTTEAPAFGPDEFAELASQLGSGILLTVNVGTGTAAEAAAWVTYWKNKGVKVGYVEIGNEMYLAGPGGSFAAMPAATYAQKFDQYAAAIHAVDPAIKLGVLGTMDTSSWCYPTCTAPAPWNQVVLQAITQKADFMAVHNNYAPGATTESQSIYESTLSYPNFIRFDNGLIEADIDLFGSAQNKKMPIAITEHASYFLTAATDINTIIAELGRNQTWASALYEALSYQGFVQDARVTMTNHINPLHYVWQAPVTLALPDFSTYPASYDPKPTQSAFGLVFQAYRELASQQYVPVTVVHSPTIDTGAVVIIPAQTATPLLDAVAARGSASAPAQGWLFLVNRSLTTDLSVAFVLKNWPAGATQLEVMQLAPGDYHAKNVSGAAPGVLWQSVTQGLLPAGTTSFGTTLTVPKGSLLRVRLK